MEKIGVHMARPHRIDIGHQQRDRAATAQRFQCAQHVVGIADRRFAAGQLHHDVAIGQHGQWQLTLCVELGIDQQAHAFGRQLLQQLTQRRQAIADVVVAFVLFAVFAMLFAVFAVIAGLSLRFVAKSSEKGQS